MDRYRYCGCNCGRYPHYLLPYWGIASHWAAAHWTTAPFAVSLVLKRQASSKFELCVDHLWLVVPIRPFTWASLQPYSRPAQHAAETIVVGLGNLRMCLSTNCLGVSFFSKKKLSWRFLKNKLFGTWNHGPHLRPRLGRRQTTRTSGCYQAPRSWIKHRSARCLGGDDPCLIFFISLSTHALIHNKF
jgi:hypothetical protein